MGDRRERASERIYGFLTYSTLTARSRAKFSALRTRRCVWKAVLPERRELSSIESRTSRSTDGMECWRSAQYIEVSAPSSPHLALCSARRLNGEQVRPQYWF